VSRGTVPGLASPYRIADFLPGIYLEEDPFIQRFTAGLDEIWAPVLATLDCLEAYLDPQLTPEDFLGWLGDWVGAVVDEAGPLALRRAAVAHAARLHRDRGTPAGLKALVELLTGAQVEVSDSGGSGWSSTPDSVPPGEAAPWVHVRVTVEGASEQSRAALRSMVSSAVASAKPAHVAHSVEVLSR
jgi:phage tail-like protein